MSERTYETPTVGKEEQLKNEMAQRILALKKERNQLKVATPITTGELAAARSVLEKMGAGRIFVVPETWDLSGGNPAICLTDGSQVTTYSELLMTDLGKYDPGAREELPKAFDLHDILVKQSVVGLEEIKKCGVVWHELGHTTLGAAENGLVFAHELGCLLKSFSKEEVEGYVKTFRTMTYFVDNAADPGLEKLHEVLAVVGFDLLGTRKKKEELSRIAMQKKLRPGFTLTGDPATFQRRAGTPQELPTGVDTMEAGSTFVWSGVTWKVLPRSHDYVLAVVHSAQESLPTGKTIQGTPTQLKGRANARDEPPGLHAKVPDEQFAWDGSTWKLVSATTVHGIEVVGV